MARPPDETLKQYRDKRSPECTPEPFGGEAVVGSSGAGVFVIQKHAARRTHYDLRLEMEGALKSWAVPKGISSDPAEKRLAVLVEDHPLEYADFEGVIPEGEYGAGAVIIWDQGRWIPLEDPLQGLEEGKLLFELRGRKLRGVWTLVKLKKSDTGRDWLLIRERRGTGPRETDAEIPETSIVSGLTVEQLGERGKGFDPGTGPRTELQRLEHAPTGPRRRLVRARSVKLMLARTREEAFSKPGWLFELKLDGFRMLAQAGEAGPLLLTRNGLDATASFPELARVLENLPFEHLLLDGEVVVNDEKGLPNFGRLQRRARIRNPIDIRRVSLERPASFYAFDLLGFEGFDLRPLPLRERKHLLQVLLPAAGAFHFLEHVEERGEALYEQVVRMGLEGVLAKRADRPYRGGRSSSWLKIRADRTGDFAVVGFTEPKGSRAGFGALHLAAWEEISGNAHGTPGHFRYAGRVGSGFSEDQLEEIRATLETARRRQPPCEGEVPGGKDNVWVEPRWVAEVRYKEWTEGSLLRQPVFLRLRDDKRPEECAASEARPSAGGESDPEALLPAPDDLRNAPTPEELPVSNVTKVFWPQAGYTKGDLIDYYRTLYPWLQPYLEDRPLVLTRYPDGIEGKHFFQKDAPSFVPNWVRTEKIRSEGAERDIAYFVVEDAASLVYLANLGTIPLHVWASRIGSLDRPDWCILDLDPKDAPFENVITIARHIRKLCDDIELPTYVKTTGSTGLHILIPLAGQVGYGESRTLAELLARLVAAQLPEIATTVRSPAKRGGRVYIDYLQNRRGQTIAAPYSVRARPGALVSAPLRWKEVRNGLQIARFTIRSMPHRVRRMKEDPLQAVLGDRPDLLAALERLHRKLEPQGTVS